jgi:hypothetical protein
MVALTRRSRRRSPAGVPEARAALASFRTKSLTTRGASRIATRAAVTVSVVAAGESTFATWRRRRRRSEASPSGSSSSKPLTTSLARTSPLRRAAPSWETRLRPVLQSLSARSTSCSQVSIRRAISISPSRVSSGTRASSPRYEVVPSGCGEGRGVLICGARPDRRPRKRRGSNIARRRGRARFRPAGTGRPTSRDSAQRPSLKGFFTRRSTGTSSGSRPGRKPLARAPASSRSRPIRPCRGGGRDRAPRRTPSVRA